VRAAVERAGIDPAQIEDAILGCGPEGITGRNIARQTVVRAGLPLASPAPPSTASAPRACKPSPWRRAASWPRAWTPIAGGMESISSIRPPPTAARMDPWIVEHKPELYLAMIETADIVAALRHQPRRPGCFSEPASARPQAQAAGRYRRDHRLHHHHDVKTRKPAKSPARSDGGGRQLQPPGTTYEALAKLAPVNGPDSSSRPAMPRSCPTAPRPA
jgi:acetyl-CoA C-acetyltransferase/acetyl-CoA acyltransferase